MESGSNFIHRDNDNDENVTPVDYKKSNSMKNSSEKIINFPVNKNNNTDSLHTINLFEWTGRDGRDFVRKDDELREVFLNLDKSVRFLHENGYCVDSFNPYEIDLVDGASNLIRINNFSKIDNPYDKSEYVKEDIFNSSCLQIGLYMHKLSELTDTKIKDNFDEISVFLPPNDVPYYRGVICRGASVYLCDYAIEKRNRDFMNLQKELSDGKNDSSVEKLPEVSEDELTNNTINKKLYKQLFDEKQRRTLREAAFINILVFPTIALTLLILFSILSFIITLFC